MITNIDILYYIEAIVSFYEIKSKVKAQTTIIVIEENKVICHIVYCDRRTTRNQIPFLGFKIASFPN
jgi:hypothetical protein